MRGRGLVLCTRFDSLPTAHNLPVMKAKRLTILACVLACPFLSCAQSGSLDMAFNPGSGENIPSTLGIALETNGQILVSGGFTTFNGVYSPSLARLNPDGSLDSSFGPVVSPYGGGQALAIQPDGKILSGSHLARLRSDGSVDVSFTSALGTPPNGPVMALALQADGKVLIAGSFSTVSGTNRNCIARVNTNGTLDVTFDPGTSIASGYVDVLGLQSAGQIIVGGDFNTFDGVPLNYLARLNTDGSMDTNFDAEIGGSGGFVNCLAVTPQDQIVIGGYFTSVNGYSRNYIARLNADGSVDTTFKPGLGPDFIVVCLATEADGKLVIGGGFSNVDATSRPGLARLNADGSLDLSFNPGTAAPNSVNCAAIQPDGKALIGGSFSSFNGTNISGIARLKGDASPMTSLQFMAAKLYFGTYLSGTVSNTYRVEWTSKFNTPSLWTPLFDVTLQTNPQFILDPSPATGTRFYRAVQTSP
jgi:uncharacterized delta-60 repeat protein